MFDFKTLRNQGWLRISSHDVMSHSELLALARLLGEPTPGRKSGVVIQGLSPVKVDDAHPRSLSAQHGIGEFPFHTDTAHWQLPAHYILFHARDPGSGHRPTMLLSGACIARDSQLSDLAKRVLFKIVNGRHSFLSTMSEPSVDGFRFRYDEGCMQPVGSDAKELMFEMSSLVNSAEKVVIDWQLGDVLFVDNWKMLHARGKPINNVDIETRLLERILIR